MVKKVLNKLSRLGLGKKEASGRKFILQEETDGKRQKTTLQQSLSDQKGEVMPHLDNDLPLNCVLGPPIRIHLSSKKREYCVYMLQNAVSTKSSNTLGKKPIILELL